MKNLIFVGLMLVTAQTAMASIGFPRPALCEEIQDGWDARGLAGAFPSWVKFSDEVAVIASQVNIVYPDVNSQEFANALREKSIERAIAQNKMGFYNESQIDVSSHVKSALASMQSRDLQKYVDLAKVALQDENFGQFEVRYVESGIATFQEMDLRTYMSLRSMEQFVAPICFR